MFFKILLFIFPQFCFFTSFAQQSPLHCYDSLQEVHAMDSLDKLYGHNKTIPQKYKLAILIALSYYPELAHTTITFKECIIKTTLNARPTLASLFFREKEKRSYVIRINTTQRKGRITLREVPFNACIGIFGHEFAHLLDYQSRSFGGVMQRLWAYTSKKRKTAYEKQIDSLTVSRGLKWQMFDWARYAMFDAAADETYKAFKKETYLQPMEIAQLEE